MKKIIVLLLSLLLITGCQNEEVSTKTAYATYYPLEYATNYMYSSFAKVKSIYPNGIDTKSYELTEKQKGIYSNGVTFIYAGVTDEVKLAAEFLNANSNLNIIDGTKGLSFSNDVCELWLDPSNYLMIARNIKSTLIDYTSNVYDEEKIDKLYNELKIKISEIDVELTMMGKNASRKNILVTDNIFNYLSKYNINVISLDENNKTIDKAYAEAKKMVKSKDIQYVYFLEDDELNERQEKFISENSIVKVPIKSMFTITEEDKNESKDYISMMNDVIDNYKKELYKK